MNKPPDSAGLTFRQDYFGDPAGWAALVCLLKDIFGIDLGPMQRLGGPDPTSMPFGWFDAEGVLAANISAFALPFVLNGRIVHAAGLQSGAVRPPWRGRGLYRDVTVKALDWCERQGFEAVILYTDKPSLYQAYGFRAIPQYRYEGVAPDPSIFAGPARLLAPSNADDLALLQSLLKARSPVSTSLSVTINAAMFLINTQLNADVHVSLLEDQQAAIAWKMDEAGRFSLLDVVATEIPALAAILGGLDIASAAVEVFFRPDKLGWAGTPQPVESGTVLMLRGLGDEAPHFPAMLSPMADF
ncbi:MULTISPECIES: GNAT family N-acetyltransferase [unclassified Rhizobium]|uniref:GNAT family N-acetyltransferase n=1 Tax=unclassified Rhizobium TaxID=2613769 RepID=UPI001C834350|nr:MULTISPECIES: GNAT family N-acetyltransferase [unclassified Rhizobium]MBX5165812.1 GNAT family N-acetyltransferase [Rhizobium sp. NZLR4b]MBX5172168.1 GNAT family N-acetyltransferase [Rhizobium sp. NZLR1b]MBX5191740.1 GNAT family N-acetyltransferase [Rhizobium sp. NZLR3b]MBX5196952.1 GNAT family N-acetyltransferase [Rhizobium sp. NZLR10]MBX5209237.1 GNAT family N-acetyltransferase [Rhizobium sp. NZLR11]